MSWAQIKSALNSSLGKKSFKALNEIVEKESYDIKRTLIESVLASTDSEGKFAIFDWGVKTATGKYTIDSRKTLRFVLFPNTLETISENAFAGAIQLKTISLPNSLKTIKLGAFTGCSSLKKCVFNGTIQEWGEVILYDGWRDQTQITEIICNDGISTRLI